MGLNLLGPLRFVWEHRCLSVVLPVTNRLGGGLVARQRYARHGSKWPGHRSGQLFVCLPLPATDNEKLALLQSPQHIVELIKTAVANGQYAAAFGFIDADSKAERIRYAFFQRNQIGVFRSAAAHGASAT